MEKISGKSAAEVTVKENELVSPDPTVTQKQEEPKIPEKSSYTFTGWFEHLDEKAPSDKELIDAFINTSAKDSPGEE